MPTGWPAVSTACGFQGTQLYSSGAKDLGHDTVLRNWEGMGGGEEWQQWNQIFVITTEFHPNWNERREWVVHV
jgi:hypothetical protein